MKKLPASLLFAALALTANCAVAQESANGLDAVAELGHANGTALACERLDIVDKAKALMIARVPKTRRYGEAFEQATDKAFREQTANLTSCPVEVILSLKLEAAGLKIDEAFPPPPR